MLCHLDLSFGVQRASLTLLLQQNTDAADHILWLTVDPLGVLSGRTVQTKYWATK